MRLTADIISNARAYYNPLRQRQLDIRGLKIPVMENLGAALDQFDVIDLSDNSITKIENIPKFTRLHTLLLCNNIISQIAKDLGSNVPNCENLNLSNNRIASFSELANLKSWTHLSNLVLVDNPIVTEKDFRVQVVRILPQIKTLNFQKERQAAEELMDAE